MRLADLSLDNLAAGRYGRRCLKAAIFVLASFASWLALPAGGYEIRTAAAGVPTTDSLLFQGQASYERRLWDELYGSGVEAARQRIYPQAEARLKQAVAEAARGGRGAAERVRARSALAEVYLATGRYRKAERLFAGVLSPAREVFGRRSQAVAQTLCGLSWLKLALHRDAEAAEKLAKEALRLQMETVDPDPRATGRSLMLLARARAARGLTLDAHDLISRAVKILEKDGGFKDLLLADALRDQALLARGSGDNRQSDRLHARATAIKEAAVDFARPPWTAGVVEFAWDNGFPSSHLISEGKYPLKVTTVKEIKVAATMLDQRQVLGVLVSVANTGRIPVKVGLGPITMDRVEPDAKPLRLLNPSTFDYVLEMETMYSLTFKQPTLRELQNTHVPPKTRHGKAPNPDNIFRKNIFGVFGNWIVDRHKTLDLLSLEREYARNHPLAEPDKFLSNIEREMDLYPVILEPGESRTSVVFFKNEPHRKVVLSVLVGNASCAFPFDYIGPWFDYR